MVAKQIRRDGIVSIIPSPLFQHLDDAGEFHSETGPTIAWEDGSVLFFIHGTRFLFDAWCVEANITDKEKAIMLLTYNIRHAKGESDYDDNSI